MAGNLTRFEPASTLRRFSPLRDFADMFDLMRPMQLFDNDMIRLDVSETDQEYRIKAEMPGVKKEDIKVSIDGDQVTISAETNAEDEQIEGNVVCRERYHGKQFRSFNLPQQVNADGAQAICNNGVLELHLPKKGGAGAKQLSIQ